MKKTVLFNLLALGLSFNAICQTNQLYMIYNYVTEGLTTYEVDANTGAPGTSVNYFADGHPSTQSAAIGYNTTNKYLYYIPEVNGNTGTFNVYSVPAYPPAATAPTVTDRVLALSNQTLATNTANNEIYFRRLGINNAGMAYMVLSSSNGTIHFARFQTGGAGTASAVESLGTMTVSDATSNTLYNGDLAFDGSGNMYVLANQDIASGITKIYKVPASTLAGTFTSTTVTELTYVATVLNKTTHTNFQYVVTGLAFSSTGNLFISAQDQSGGATGTNAGIFMVTKDASGVVEATQTTIHNNGIADLASAYFPTTTILPVVFNKVEAKIKDNQLIINWETSSEENNDRFDIEVSKDGKVFKKIGQSIKSKALNGNSGTILSYEASYSLNDLMPLLGLSLLAFVFVAGAKNRKKYMIIGAVTLLSAGLFSVSCNKNSSEEIDQSNYQKVFVRIAQTNKDATVGYSRVYTALRSE